MTNEQWLIEVKSPTDDMIRGVGQCFEAIAAGYNPAVIVTTLRVAKKLLPTWSNGAPESEIIDGVG